MKSKIQRGSQGVYTRRAKALSQQLGNIARQGAVDGRAHAQKGLQLNVYGTPAGNRYVRTSHLMNRLYVLHQVSRTSLSITLGNQASYASQIEHGTGPWELSDQQLLKHLEGLPAGGYLVLGRSGQKYLLPGPYIGPALFFAQHQTHQRIQELLRDMWA